MPVNTLSVTVLASSAPALSDGSKPEQFVEKTTIGGTVYATTFLTVGQGMRVASNFGTVRFQELPDPALTEAEKHKPEEDHIDFYLCFYEAGNWEKLYDPDGPTGPKVLDWWPSVEAPQYADSASGPVQYRFRFALNSGQKTGTPYVFPGQPATTLPGHNGAHRFSYVCSDVDLAKPKLAFTSAYGGAALAETIAKEVIVKNTVFTNVFTSNGTSHYFKYAREDPNVALRQPSVVFMFADEGDPHSYKWAVRVRATNEDEDPSGVIIRGTASVPGRVEAKINNPTASGQTQEGYDKANPDGNGIYTPITQYGTYTFDISIQEVDEWGNNLDEVQSYRSAKTFFPYYFTDTNSQRVRGHSGKIVTGADGIERYYANYYIRDTSPNLATGAEASVLVVQMLPPGMANLAATSTSSWVKKLNTPVKDVLLKTFTTPREAGTYIIPFTGVDNHKKEYRDHKNKPLLAKNDRVTNTPTLFNDTRGSDKVVSAKEATLPGGTKVLHIEIFPLGSKILVGLRRKAGSARGTTFFKMEANGQTSLTNEIPMTGEVKDGKPVKQEIVIHGGFASDKARNMELFMRTDPAKTSLGFTMGEAQGSELVQSWDFTVFRVDVAALTSGDITTIIPNTAQANGGSGLVPGVPYYLSSAYSGFARSNDLGVKIVVNSTSCRGGIAFKGIVQPSGMKHTDFFHDAPSRVTGFDWDRTISIRVYDENNKLMDDGRGKNFLDHIAADNLSDNMGIFAKDLSAGNDFGETDSNLYIWDFDAPSLVSANIPQQGNIARIRARFVNRVLYAKVPVSSPLPWYFRASIEKSTTTGDMILNEKYAGDNQVAVGDTALTYNLLQNSSVVAATITSIDPTSMSISDINQPANPNMGQIQGVINGSNLTPIEEALCYAIKDDIQENKTYRSIVSFDPVSAQSSRVSGNWKMPKYGAGITAGPHTVMYFKSDKGTVAPEKLVMR